MTTIAKKTTVETTVSTTFILPLAELLERYIPKEEMKPRCAWWVVEGPEAGSVQIIRSERTAIGYTAEGREQLEAEEP